MRDTPNYIKLTDANFQKEVLESTQLVLVDFLGGLVWILPYDRPGHRRIGG